MKTGVGFWCVLIYVLSLSGEDTGSDDGLPPLERNLNRGDEDDFSNTVESSEEEEEEEEDVEDCEGKHSVDRVGYIEEELGVDNNQNHS